MAKRKYRRSGLKIMASLIALLGKLAYLIVIAVIGGYLGNICAISVMVLGATSLAKLIDPSCIGAPLWVLIMLTIVAGVLRGLLRFMEQYNNHYIAFKLLACLREKIFAALRKLAPAKLEEKGKGDIISMLTSDVETLEVFYAHTISPVIIAILVDGSVFAFVWAISNVYLALVALAAYLIIGILIPFLSSALLEKDGVLYRKQFAETSSYFLDSIKGIGDIVINNNEGAREEEIAKQSDYMNKRSVQIKEKSSSVGSLSNLVVSFAILLSTFVGVLSVIHLNLNLAYMIIALVALFSSFGPVLSLANLPSNLTQTFASGDRILNFMEEKPEVEEKKDGVDFTFENVEFKQVNFSYDKQPILENINFKINQGEIIGLVGDSGCGKSTLLKLLLRFYDTKKGDILYNGIPIQNVNTASLASNVIMVSQDTYLFDDTILNNLKFVKPNASLAEIREACKKASIDDFIMSQPNGYESEVGLLGDSLSAGEKQRIGLARAFLSGAKLILLDEVTSNVDAMNEGIILSSLLAMRKDHTLVLVTHRESTASICSSIYHIKEGKIQA